MPWCPKCKNEYREGMLICTDCKLELVEQLPERSSEDYEQLISLKEEEVAKRLVSYLEYSSIRAYMESDEAEGFAVFVLKKKLQEAKKAFGAFYSVEMTAAQAQQAEVAAAPDAPAEDSAAYASKEEELEEELEEALAAPSAAYVKKSEKSADYRSSAITFLLFGAVGLVAMILHWAGVYVYFTTVSTVILTVMFAGFILIGIDSMKRAKKAQKEALEETRFTEELTRWLEEHLTLEMLTAVDQPELSREANFLNEMKELKLIICKQFGTLDAAFLEQFTEEYYNEHFDANV